MEKKKYESNYYPSIISHKRRIKRNADVNIVYIVNMELICDSVKQRSRFILQKEIFKINFYAWNRFLKSNANVHALKYRVTDLYRVPFVTPIQTILITLVQKWKGSY